MKAGRKPNLVMENRIRLNAGKYSASVLANVLGVNIRTVEKRASRMKVSLRVRKEKP